MVGDMNTIMSNTGGDNRVEFVTAMDHSIWYESPKFGGFSFDAFFSPGQNRTADANLNLAGGSSNCTGGNVPGSGNLLLDLRRRRFRQCVQRGPEVRMGASVPDGGLRTAQACQSQQRRHRVELARSMAT